MSETIYNKVSADERAQILADSRDIYEHDQATRIAEAEEKGRIKTIIELVSSGYITVEIAAEKLGMNVEEIKARMSE